MTYSIIIPTYNSEKWIKNCINSVLSQTLNDYEILILDSGSSDGTLEWICSLHDNRIKVYPTEERLNIKSNWARITGVSKNEFMTILGHDDILHPDYLSTIDTLVKTYPDASLYLTHFNLIDENGNIIRSCKSMDLIYRQINYFEAILKDTIEINATGYMVRSRDYDQIGGMPGYPNLLYADFELWLKLIGSEYLVVSANNSFSFRLHTKNTSKKTDLSKLNAFERLIQFFKKLVDQDPSFKKLVLANGESFFKNFLIGSSHKLIYVPKVERNGVTMNEITATTIKCANSLVPKNNYHIENIFALKIAKVIDAIPLLRKSFLFYKSFFTRTY